MSRIILISSNFNKEIYEHIKDRFAQNDINIFETEDLWNYSK